MNRKTVAIGAILAAAVLVSGIMISLTIMAGRSQARAAGENVTYQYVLKSFENKIAVYEKGKGTPIKILEVPVDTLPYLEQSALENGVQIRNEEELRKTIEDFTG